MNTSQVENDMIRLVSLKLEESNARSYVEIAVVHDILLYYEYIDVLNRYFGAWSIMIENFTDNNNTPARRIILENDS